MEKEVEDRLTIYSVRVFWDMDMSGFLEPQAAETGPTLIVNVSEDGTNNWDPEGVRLIGHHNKNTAKKKIMVACFKVDRDCAWSGEEYGWKRYQTVPLG